MKVRYDAEADIPYIFIKGGKIKDTAEVGEDIFVEYGENDEIWQARKSIIPSIIEYIEKGKVVGV
ncbi:MAG: DUF2283 domain-containing protein [Archaeoglobaceae archaeon]|nr:DUF2283 domain-containing protein [Archaeoglobaceae archaeon]